MRVYICDMFIICLWNLVCLRITFGFLLVLSDCIIVDECLPFASYVSLVVCTYFRFMQKKKNEIKESNNSLVLPTILQCCFEMCYD